MDHEADPEEIGNLKHHAQACAEHFKHLLHHEESGKILITENDGFWVTRQCAEFNLWCAKVGIHAEGLRSLDVRLKDVPEICDIFLQLLQSLRRDLYELRHPKETIAHLEKIESNHADDLKSNASCYSFDSLSSSDDSENTGESKEPISPERKRRLELQQQVVDTIDRLQGQAKRIERAGARHRRRRIEVYREKERKLYDNFMQLGTWKAKQQFESASPVTVDRIAESFARRRIRFAYLQKHQKKRAVDAAETSNPNPGPLVEENGDKAQNPSIQPREAAKQSDFRGTRHAQDQQTLLSATVDTKLDLLPEPKRTERAESVRSIALRHPGFPPPPQTKDGRFQCPYCILDFRDVEAAPDRWKQHVMQDFEPYFCTFEKCKSPFDVSNSFEGLLDHMQSHVPLRHHIYKPDGEHIELAEAEFETHVKSHGEVSLGTMNLMKANSRRKLAFLFDSCPFCGGYPDVVEKRFPDPDTIDAQVELRKHIKQHMQEIALFLPPYRSDIFERDDDSKQSDATHRRSSPDEIPPDDDFVSVCSRESCDCEHRSTVDEDLQLPEPRAEAHPEKEKRWTCCLCGNNYMFLATQAKCTYRPCNSHRPCNNCDLYFYDYSRDGDWSSWLGATSIYDRSKASNEELIADERLHFLVLHFAGFKSEIKEEQGGARRTVILEQGLGGDRERTAIVQDVIKSYTRLHYQSPGDNSQPRLPGKDPVFRLQERLISKITEEPESDRGPDDSEVLEISLEDIKPRHGNHFPAKPDPFENVHTEAMHNGVPVWVEWFCSNPISFRHLDRVLELRALEIVSILLRHQGLKKEWPVPPCRGYLRDEEEGRYGLVFQKPIGVDPEATTVTLRQLFTQPGFNMPSLSQRVHIIHNLQSAVESLHLDGLMHQDMSSDSVFFFIKDEAIDPEFNPYISGFGYPRLPTHHVEMSGNPRMFLYRHPRHLPDAPNHRSDNQLVLDDLYALAIVLIEIAHWNPIDDILGISINADYHIISVITCTQNALLGDGDTKIWVQTRRAIGDVVTSAIRAYMERVKAEWPETEDLETHSIDSEPSDLYVSRAAEQAIERAVKPRANLRDQSSHSPPLDDVANVNHSPAELVSRHPASLVEPQLMTGTNTAHEGHDRNVSAGRNLHEMITVDESNPMRVVNGNRPSITAEDREDSQSRKGKSNVTRFGLGLGIGSYRVSTDHTSLPRFGRNRLDEQGSVPNSDQMTSDATNVFSKSPIPKSLPGKAASVQPTIGDATIDISQGKVKPAMARANIDNPASHTSDTDGKRKPESRLRTWLKDQWPRTKKNEKSSEAQMRDISSTPIRKTAGLYDRASPNVLDQSASTSVHPISLHGVDFSFEGSPTTPRDMNTTPVDETTTPMVMNPVPFDDLEDPEVLFLAASLFDFTLPNDRKEGGIPYLAYRQGEIFDVIGMKGELWLARNQEDDTKTLGWIWEKHFARILPEDE